MALSKVTRQIRDGTAVLFNFVFARTAAIGDLPAHAVIDTSENLIDPATAGKQDSIITLLTTQAGYLDGVEGFLSSILAKIIAAPATEAKQDSLIAKVPAALSGSGNFKVALTEQSITLPVSGTFWQATQPVSAASLPLPSGAATSAKQDTLAALLPTSLGAKSTANSLAVTLPSDVSFGFVVSFPRTGDTSLYAANDVIGVATGSTAALTFTLGAGAGEYIITGAALEIDAAAIISGETSYNLYLYNVTPPSALGDNAAFDIPSGDRASFLGKIPLGSPVDEGSTLYVETNNINKQITLASGSLFGYLVTVGTYTPTASRVYVVTLHTVKA